MTPRDLMTEMAITFAMYCDQTSLTYEEGLRLAEEVADEIGAAAEDRSNYLPASHMPAEAAE